MFYRNKVNIPKFETWKEIFVRSEKYSQLSDICYDDRVYTINPRDRHFRKTDINKNLHTIFWYEWIINQINCDDLVLDIGCGNNLFKPLYSTYNIIGTDKGDFSCDIQAHLRDLDEYKGKLKSAFCFNSIHFADDQGFKSNLEYLSNLLQPNCFAVVTVNNLQINRRREKSIDLKIDSVNRIYDTIWLSNEYDLVYFESLIEYTNIRAGLVGDIHLVIRSK
tara:strand:- start:3518 stop:4180 length:663 start_codon:yes stop_codon:yes gene_type:complete